MPTTHPKPAERLIVALDVPTRADALDLAHDLAGLVSFYKVGLQLFIAEGMPLVRALIESGNNVFLDLKMDDVDETIRLATEVIARNGPRMLTLQGSAATVRAAVAGRGANAYPKILFVTLLSSMNDTDLAELRLVGDGARFANTSEYVQWRARTALAAGADGLIASGDTIGELRKALGPTALIVSPGIRPSSAASHEHKRATTPASAIAAGADYLVVGRPIRDAVNRREMAEQIIADMSGAARS